MVRLCGNTCAKVQVPGLPLVITRIRHKLANMSIDVPPQSMEMNVGELARRLGVTTDVLRAWERRHGLFSPRRSASGYRLYSADDERRGHRVLRMRAEGRTLADSVAAVLADPDGAHDRPTAFPSAGPVGRAVNESVATPALERFMRAATAAVKEFDDHAFDGAVRLLRQAVGTQVMLTHAVVPFLRQVGSEWETGRVAVAHEHFASQAVRRNLHALPVPVPQANAPRALLACPVSEEHDLGAAAFAHLLTLSGWSVRNLGANTPTVEVALVARKFRPHVIVMSATRETAFIEQSSTLRGLAGRWTLAVAGSGATRAVASRVGARLLRFDMAEAVQDLAAARPVAS